MQPSAFRRGRGVRAQGGSERGSAGRAARQRRGPWIRLDALSERGAAPQELFSGPSVYGP